MQTSNHFGLRIAVLLLALTAASAAHAGQTDPDFELRPMDEVFYKDGSHEVGIISELTGGPWIKNPRTQAGHDLKMENVSKILKRRTVETGLDEFAADYASSKNAPQFVKRMRKAYEMWGNQNNTKKIISALEKAASTDPDLLDLLSELYTQNNQPVEVLRSATTLIAAAPKRASGYMWRGQAEMSTGKMTEADTDLLKAFELAPEDEAVIVARAKFFIAIGKPEQSAKMLKDILARNGKNPTALVAQGMIYLQQCDYDNAEQSFNAALDTNREHVQANIGLAAVKLMQQKYDEAYRIGDHVLAGNPNAADAYAIEAYAKLFSGDKESLNSFEKIIPNAFKDKPEQPRLKLAWATALEREAKYEELTGGKDGPANAQAKRELAATKYKELLSSDPHDAYLQYVIAEKKFRDGDYSGAEVSFGHVANELAPRYAPAQAAAGAVALRLQKFDQALKYYDAASKLDDKCGEYLAGQGLAQLGLKDMGKARENFQRALQLDSRNVSAMAGLGYFHNSTREKALAVGYFQNALGVDGRCAYAAEALKKIYLQENMSLEYLTFDDNANPPNWNMRGAVGSIRPELKEGHVLFAGTQGASNGGNIEYYKTIKSDEFVRLEADFDLPANSPALFGLRLSGGANSRFDFVFGKKDDDVIAYKYNDFQASTEKWQTPTPIKWSAEGRVRLGLESEDSKLTKVILYVNGVRAWGVPLNVARPGNLSVGVYMQVPASTTVRGTVDNVALVVRMPSAPSEKDHSAVEVFNNPPAPAPAPAPAPPKDAPKDK